MKPIKLSDVERKKPLSYDPKTKKYLYLDDIKKGNIFSPTDLDEKLQRKLTIARLDLEESFSIESLGAMNKEQMMAEIRECTNKGNELVRAEINFLKETIKEIKKGELV